jgi:hypothetical protein
MKTSWTEERRSMQDGVHRSPSSGLPGDCFTGDFEHLDIGWRHAINVAEIRVLPVLCAGY